MRFMIHYACIFIVFNESKNNHFPFLLPDILINRQYQTNLICHIISLKIIYEIIKKNL